MPTAMPPAPLTSRLGKRAGRTCGSRSRRVVIGLEVDRVLVDVAEQEIGDLGEPRFGVAHGRRRIGVHRAEIALAVDQRHAHRPALRHAGEGVVDRAVAVRVIFTHDVTDDAARLAVGPAGDIAGFLAGVEDAAVDRLQAVAHVGQRAADDDATSHNRGSWSSSPRRWRWGRCRCRDGRRRGASWPRLFLLFKGKMDARNGLTHPANPA